MTFSDFIRLKDQQIESAKKLQKLDKHLTFVHEEVAKSIHIIDKHSVEMDDLTGKILGVQDFIEKQDENQDKQVLGNLQSHLNLIQTQVSEFKGEFFFNSQSLKSKMLKFPINMFEKYKMYQF